MIIKCQCKTHCVIIHHAEKKEHRWNLSMITWHSEKPEGLKTQYKSKVSVGDSFIMKVPLLFYTRSAFSLLSLWTGLPTMLDRMEIYKIMWIKQHFSVYWRLWIRNEFVSWHVNSRYWMQYLGKMVCHYLTLNWNYLPWK